MAYEKNIDKLIEEDYQRRSPFGTIFDRLEGYMGPTDGRQGPGGLLSQLMEENPESFQDMSMPQQVEKPRDLFQMVRDWGNDKRKPQFMGKAPMNEVNKQITGKEIY